MAINREISDKDGEGIALSNIGITLEKQKQPELAIVFHKQSVNMREGIRQGIRSLDRNLQESYTQSVAGTYRQLADLLIAQGRIGEAQQVLERLKIQELNDFTKGTRAPKAVAEVGFNAAETQTKGKYTSLIAFGGQFYDCEQQRCAQYSELKTQYQSLAKEFQAFVKQVKQQLRDSRLTQVDKATHGEFKPANPRGSYFLLGTVIAYPIQDVQTLRDLKTVHLVVLSACQTGLGGADGSKPAIAQNYSHPYYWAPFILIGNGL